MLARNIRESMGKVKVNCDHCGCVLKGEYDEEILTMVQFTCLTCLAIDTKTKNPNANVEPLLNIRGKTDD